MRRLILVLLVLVALFWLFPLLMALLNSFKTRAELFTNIIAFPDAWNLDNYVRSFKRMNYVRSLINTIIIAAGGISGIILFSAMAGWVLCRVKTRLSLFLFSAFVFSMLIPFHAIMIPLYQVARLLRLSNSLGGMGVIYSGLGVGMAVFMYHGFVKTIPLELEDAASIDGCSGAGVFFRVVFPLLLPITATISIMNVLWMWNDFLLPLIMLRNSRKYTLLLSTNMLFGQYGSDWPAILSALILTVIPVLLIYAVLQKQIIKGIVDGALKG
ncbi:MAG: carbohydrate ABC transporter permease [Spirochaetaceae bacterium]|nr:MAG: carbohydrate ABC transporter permease [Spirochaetaceae bacterium]